MVTATNSSLEVLAIGIKAFLRKPLTPRQSSQGRFVQFLILAQKSNTSGSVGCPLLEMKIAGAEISQLRLLLLF